MKTSKHSLIGAFGAMTMSVFLAAIMVIGLNTEYHSSINRAIRWIFEAWLYPIQAFMDVVIPLVGYEYPDPYSVSPFITVSWFIYTATAGFAAGFCLSWGFSKFTLIKK